MMPEVIASSPINVTVSTPGTPLWLTLLTLGISIFAVLISLWQALATSADRHRNLPKVRVSASYTDHLYAGELRDVRAVMISAWNRGREATNVTGMIIDTPNATINGIGSNLIIGPDLPFKLESYSGETWAVDAAILQDNVVDVHFSLGHGPRIHLRCEIDRTRSVTIGRRTKVLKAMLPSKLRSKFLETRDRELHVH